MDKQFLINIGFYCLGALALYIQLPSIIKSDKNIKKFPRKKIRTTGTPCCPSCGKHFMSGLILTAAKYGRDVHCPECNAIIIIKATTVYECTTGKPSYKKKF